MAVTIHATTPVPEWPKRADGSPKKIGEMTKAEKDGVFRRAAARVREEFEDPHVKASIARVLKGYEGE